jgi:hypothetical protein
MFAKNRDRLSEARVTIGLQRPEFAAAALQDCPKGAGDRSITFDPAASSALSLIKAASQLLTRVTKCTSEYYLYMKDDRTSHRKYMPVLSTLDRGLLIDRV